MLQAPRRGRKAVCFSYHFSRDRRFRQPALPKASPRCLRTLGLVPIKPIAEPRLYQRIAAELGRLIDEGTFPAGSRLPAERTLAQSLRVSRSSLREALSMLELERRIEIRVGSGAYVATAREAPKRAQGSDAASAGFAEAAPLEVLQVRRLVEGEAAALAAAHATPAQVAQLAAAFEELARQTRANGQYRAADREFHLCIARACANAALAQVIEGLWEESERPLNARMKALFVSPERRRDNIGEHEAILDAIRQHDPARARRAMRLHLANAARQRLVELRKAPG